MNATLPLRLTYKESDIIFYILNEKPSAMEHISVSLEGQTYKLNKEMGRWKVQDESSNTDINLLAAIGDSIALRYRI